MASPVASFTKEVNTRLAKWPLVFNGRLASRVWTSLLKEVPGLDGLTFSMSQLNDSHNGYYYYERCKCFPFNCNCVPGHTSLPVWRLTNWGGATHKNVTKLCHHWFRYWPVACSTPGHYLSQCWLIVICIFENLFENWKTKIKQLNGCENAVCKIRAILSGLQAVYGEGWCGRLVRGFDAAVRSEQPGGRNSLTHYTFQRLPGISAISWN